MAEELEAVAEVEVATPEVESAEVQPEPAPLSPMERRDERLRAALEADSQEGDEDTPEEEEAAEEAEAAPDEATEAEPEPEEEEELESERLAHLRTQMREIANGQQQLKEERHAFKQEQERYRSEVTEMRETMAQAAQMAKENPPELMRRLGVDIWKWVEDTIGDGASDPHPQQSTPQFDPNQLEQRMASLIEEKLSGFAESQKREAQRRSFDQRIYGEVSNPEKYPEMAKQTEKSVELVRSAVLDHFNKTGERLTPEDVAPHVEKYLFNKRATAIKEAQGDPRYSDFFGSSGETPQERAPAPKPTTRAPTPMTNELTSESSVPSGPKTREERLAAATAMAIGNDIKF